jgi:hypothetical protein
MACNIFSYAPTQFMIKDIQIHKCKGYNCKLLGLDQQRFVDNTPDGGLLKGNVSVSIEHFYAARHSGSRL